MICIMQAYIEDGLGDVSRDAELLGEMEPPSEVQAGGASPNLVKGQPCPTWECRITWSATYA